MMEGFADLMPVERRLVTRCHVCVMTNDRALVNKIASIRLSINYATLVTLPV